MPWQQPLCGRWHWAVPSAEGTRHSPRPRAERELLPARHGHVQLHSNVRCSGQGLYRPKKKEMYPLPRSEFNPPRWALNVPNMKPWLLVCLISGVKGSISFDITNCSSVVRKLLKSVFHPQHWARFFHQLYIPPMVVTPQGTCRDVHDSSHVGGITNSSGFWDVQMWQNRQNRLSLSALQDQEGVLCHQTKHNRGRGSASQAATV